MTDSVATINTVISEHHATRLHIRLAGDSISDEEAVATLKAARTDWIPGRLAALGLRRRKLEQTLCYLREGLSNHFAAEETLLPLLLDQVLTRAIVLDHRRILESMDEALAAVADLDLQGPDRESLLAMDSKVQQLIDHVCHLIEDHATKEDIVLDMMLRALREE